MNKEPVSTAIPVRQNNHIPPVEDRRQILDLAVEAVNEFYESIDELAVQPDIDPHSIRDHLKQFEFEDPIPPQELVSDVAERMRSWNLHTPHPRYFGLFNPASNIFGIAADLLVAGFNPQVGAWHHNPFGVEVEAHLIKYFARQFGLGESAYGNFTSGGSEANFSAVVVALTRQFPEFAKSGVRQLPNQPTLYCSEEFHHSFVKIAHQCGLGREAVRLVPVTDACVMDVNQLQRKIADDRQNGFAPFMIVGTGGTTNAGLVEPLSQIADVAGQEDLHFHVDAAWGGGVILSDRHKHVLSGIERADTITFDPHKMLSVPMGAGMFFVRQHQWLREAFGLQTDYVPESPTEDLDTYQLTFQFSRRLIGLKLFMTLAALGKEGVANAIERQLDLAKLLAAKLECAGFAVVNGASLGVVCFLPPDEWGFQEHREYEELADQVRKSGDAWISTTKLAGRSVLRACITNHLTQPYDLDRFVALLQTCAHKS